MSDYAHEASDLAKKPQLWRAGDLKPAAPMQWVATRRLPRSAVSLLVGDEGIGKSLLWVLIVAHITTGKPFPGFGLPSREPAFVVIVVTEDDWSSTVRPRLEVAGANLDYVIVICEEEDGSGAPIFPRDMYLVEEAIRAFAPVLVVVDAWLDTVPSGYNVRDPQHARLALHPWREMATVGDLAVLLLTHTNRVASGNARDKYGATAELRKKARMTLFAQIDGDGVLTVGPEKSNLVGGVQASTFSIATVQYFNPTEDNDGTVPLLKFAGESAQTAREILVSNHESASDEGASIDDWLLGFIGREGKSANDVFKAADANGFSKDQAKRAKHRLGVKSEKSGDGPWRWVLPADDQEGKGAQATRISDNCSLTPLQVNEGAEGSEGSKGASAHDTPSRALDEYGFLLEPDLGSVA